MKQSYIYAVLFSAALAAACFTSCTADKKEKLEIAEEKQQTGDTSLTGRKLEELNTLVIANPGNADLLHKRAKLYINKNDFPKALDDIQQALNIDSTKADYFVTFSDIQLAGNKPSRAKASLEKSLSLDPENIEAHMKLGELYFIARNYDQVFFHINKVLKKDIHNPHAYMMKGMAYKEIGDTSKALSNFKTAIEQDPAFYPPFMQLGMLYSMQNDELALQYYNGALKIQPSSIEALYGRAMWYQENEKNYDKAIQDYTSIIQISPQNKYAHFNLGYVHYEYLKVFDQAIKHYSDAINIDPNYAEAYYNRGLVYESIGNVAAARSDYAKALSIRGDYALAKAGMQRVKQ